MGRLRDSWLGVGAVLFCAVMFSTCGGPRPGSVKDEARQDNEQRVDYGKIEEKKWSAEDEKRLPGSDSDYLRDMDRGLDAEAVHKALPFLTKEDAWKAYNRGRNNWVVWSAGNDKLWDFLANNSFGAFDLLKIVSSYPRIRYCGNSIDYANDNRGSSKSSGDSKDKQSAYDEGKSSPVPYPPGYYAYEDDDDQCRRENRKFYEVTRENRWKYFGLVNEPGFKQWKAPETCYAKSTDGKAVIQDDKPSDPTDKKQWCGNRQRWGLWLDVGAPDPFESDIKYPGIKIGARGKKDIFGDEFRAGSYYGYASGVVGLRLFPNPDFDEAAQKKWDPWRYYNDPAYYSDKKLVRPYRVGMSCGFCHVGPSPIDPPKDPENPEWKNLNSNPGAQYFWLDRIFFWNPAKRHENFIYQIFRTSLPGTLDTSLVSSDNINNPRTMNAVYSIAARLKMAEFHPEKLTGGERNNKQFNDYDRTKELSKYFKSATDTDTILAPHVLKDGADSVGVLGALNRVYINIGLFSEEWLLHFKPLIGNLPGKRITPIEIKRLEQNSAYWNANVAQTPDLALFFLASAQPDYLKDAPEGKAYLTTDKTTLDNGKRVFAENCARCHSGKQPEVIPAKVKECKDSDYLKCWGHYWEWTETEEYKTKMRDIVKQPDFLKDNFLSTELRVPVTLLKTNACSPLATNGLRDNIWDNFTSTTYKDLKEVGKFEVHNPITDKLWMYEMPGGGRGYTRPASLISLWSTAPYLLNNSVGNFYGEPSVEARMAAFNDSIRQMLWPNERTKDIDGIRKLGLPLSMAVKDAGYIQRTTTRSYLKVGWGYLPGKFAVFMEWLSRWLPWLFSENGLEIGPIPKGTPIGLLANLSLVSDSMKLEDREAYFKDLIALLKDSRKVLKALPDNATDEQAWKAFGNLGGELYKLSKCPDFVVNRGHDFGTKLSDDDKNALIEFLRTF